ncbi:MAG: DUF1080 domain-containing protein, partial [Rhodothermales bacterium]|nr:DUF1080 domain-containing protein [Rhodothermales bacterium]
MKSNKPLLVVCVAVAAALASCQPDAEAPEDETDTAAVDAVSEWEWLFDGSGLDKWRGYRMDHVPEAWTVQDSAIYCAGQDGGDLMTKSAWQNFDLRLEWKISEGGNSGIMYRVMEIYDFPYLTGPEFQVLDDASHPDAANGSTRTTGAVYDVYAPVA